MSVAMGVSLGQKHEPTALCAVEGARRISASGGSESHFVVRFLERMPSGTTFPEAADRLGQILRGITEKTRRWPQIYVDATGLGSPIISLMEARARWVTAVYFNHGDRRIEESMDEVRLGKAWLVARLQALLQTQRLHLPEGESARALARDLLDHQIHVSPDANERYGAFPVGTQDDLVTALGLAVQLDPPVPTRRRRYAAT